MMVRGPPLAVYYSAQQTTGQPGGGAPGHKLDIVRRHQPLAVLHHLQPSASPGIGVVKHEKSESRALRSIPFR